MVKHVLLIKHARIPTDASLVTEVDTKEVDERGKHVTSKDRILKQCKVRADDWADVVMMRVTGAPSD